MFSGKIVRHFIRTDVIISSNWTFGAGALASLMIVGTGWTNLALAVRLKSSLVRVFANGTFTVTSLNSCLGSNFRKFSNRASDTFGICVSDIQVRTCWTLISHAHGLS